MPASRHQSSADAGSRGRLFSSSCEERPAVSWHRSLSRSRHDGREYVVVLAVVVPEGELVEVERQIPRGDVMEVTHDAALDQRPEAVDVGGMDLAADVLAGLVVDRLVRPVPAESPVALVLFAGLLRKRTSAGARLAMYCRPRFARSYQARLR